LREREQKQRQERRVTTLLMGKMRDDIEFLGTVLVITRSVIILSVSWRLVGSWQCTCILAIPGSSPVTQNPITATSFFHY
jgi:hypothetical protein